MSPDPDDFLDEEEQQDYASRSIFSAGWFRAVLVLTVLAIVVVVSLPYLLNWFEPTAPRREARTPEPVAKAPGPEPPSALIPAPPEKAPAPPPPAAQPAQPPPPAEPPPAASPAPAPPAAKVQPEKPAGPAAKPALPPRATRPTAPAPRRPEQRVATLAPKAEPGGGWWVQVGAFTEAKNAEGLAQALKGAGFAVEVQRVVRAAGAARPGVPLHQLFVSGASAETVTAALKGRGVAEAAPGGGVSVRPAYDLKEAMSLSRQLAAEGLNVVIRRAPAPAGGGVFYIVRVGAFDDRARAQQAREDLGAKGHPGFLAQGPAR